MTTTTKKKPARKRPPRKYDTGLDVLERTVFYISIGSEDWTEAVTIAPTVAEARAHAAGIGFEGYGRDNDAGQAFVGLDGLREALERLYEEEGGWRMTRIIKKKPSTSKHVPDDELYPLKVFVVHYLKDGKLTPSDTILVRDQVVGYVEGYNSDRGLREPDGSRSWAVPVAVQLPGYYEQPRR